MALNSKDIKQKAQSYVRGAFSVAFNRQALKHYEEHKIIMQKSDESKYRKLLNQTKTSDPYKGILIPTGKIDNGSYWDSMGLFPRTYSDPKYNVVSSLYDDPKIKSLIDPVFDKTIAEINGFIGNDFSVGEMDGFRKKLSDIWGDKVNFILPFSHGFSSYHGTQYTEAVFDVDSTGNKFVLNGFTKSEGARIDLYCKLGDEMKNGVMEFPKPKVA